MPTCSYEWDEGKRCLNIAKHDVDFELVHDFDWDCAWTREDRRNDYGEKRFVSAGMIGERLYVLVWTPRNDVVRVISLRKANDREMKSYERAQDIYR